MSATEANKKKTIKELSQLPNATYRKFVYRRADGGTKHTAKAQ